jgi:hypothetical protein
MRIPFRRPAVPNAAPDSCSKKWQNGERDAAEVGTKESKVPTRNLALSKTSA